MIILTPVPSILLPMISLLSESSINPADDEMFNDSEKLSDSERVALQQPSSLCLIIPLSQNNQLLPIALCTKCRASPPPFSDLEIENLNQK